MRWVSFQRFIVSGAGRGRQHQRIALPWVRAFRHRNFRLYFGGQSVSLIGTWVQQIALGWTIYELTHSSLLLGIVSFAGQLPLFVVTPFAGVLVDRWNRHKTLITTQTLSMLQALALALVVVTHMLAVWNLIALNVFAGIILARQYPGQSLTDRVCARRSGVQFTSRHAGLF